MDTTKLTRSTMATACNAFDADLPIVRNDIDVKALLSQEVIIVVNNRSRLGVVHELAWVVNSVTV